MVAVRDGPVLAVKEKLKTLLVTPMIVSHDWSLAGANGSSRFSVAGTTAGKASLPAARPSNFDQPPHQRERLIPRKPLQ
jgi:hypothetical protein